MMQEMTAVDRAMKPDTAHSKSESSYSRKVTLSASVLICAALKMLQSCLYRQQIAEDSQLVWRKIVTDYFDNRLIIKINERSIKIHFLTFYCLHIFEFFIYCCFRFPLYYIWKENIVLFPGDYWLTFDLWVFVRRFRRLKKFNTLNITQHATFLHLNVHECVMSCIEMLKPREIHNFTRGRYNLCGPDDTSEWEERRW